VNVRSDTDARPSYEQRAPHTGRLVAWCVFVGLLALLAYAARAAGGETEPDALYRYSTTVGGLIQAGIMLLVTTAIAGFDRSLLALRRPVSWRRAALLMLAVVVVVFVANAFLEGLVHGGEEQGLTPDDWQPDRAGAYVANGAVLVGVVPVVEELLFRGIGFTLLAPLGPWAAIVGTTVAFGLAHGLIGGFVQIAVLGLALAWLRWRVNSVVPGIIIHGAFNLFAIVAAVTVGD
jgi:membrane protease YdiL (CAAX protease family)